MREIVLLPITYFHVVFTCDHAINILIRANPRVIYDLLFDVAAGLLKEYGRKYLGGEIGATGVLHTWGETLELHPHLHFLLTGGACFFDEEGNLHWKHSPANFLFPALALSRDFRNRVCDGLLKLWRQGKLQLAGECANLDVRKLVAGMRSKKWEVFIKPAHGQGVTIFEYLGRYINRIAFSNYRLLSFDGGQVRFRYHDNRDGGKEKVMTLEALEFMRRFLQHVLPSRYVRIRHYGLHHSGKRKLLQQCRTLLGLPSTLPVVKPLRVVDWLTEILGHHPNQCPRCGEVMMRRGEFGPLGGVWLWLLTLLGLLVKRKVTA